MSNKTSVKVWEFKEKEVRETIIKTIDETAKSIVEHLKTNNMIKQELSYYKKVEILLYNYRNLLEAVQQKKEDIEYIEKNGLPEASKSIVAYSSARGNSQADRYLELKEGYMRAIAETERDINKIENAIEKIRKDEYFEIIKLKYLEDEDKKLKSDEEIAEAIEKNRKTVARNRKRLINSLVTILFPESIREII